MSGAAHVQGSWIFRSGHPSGVRVRNAAAWYIMQATAEWEDGRKRSVNLEVGLSVRGLMPLGFRV